MKAEDIMLKLQIGFPSEELTLEEMNKLWRRYGSNWWKDKRMNFDSNPLYYKTNSQFSPRKTQW